MGRITLHGITKSYGSVDVLKRIAAALKVDLDDLVVD